MRFLKALLCLAFLVGFSQTSANSLNKYLEKIKSDPNALYAFFKKMPKGGELHYHLDGGAYPETMLDLAKERHFCVEPNTFVIKPFKNECSGITAQDLLSQQNLYTKTIQAWSMSDFVAGQESPHDHFHAVFAKINGLESYFRPQLLAEIMQRAANQNELYLEIYLSADSLHAMSFSPFIKNKTSMADKKQTLLANPDFQKNIQHTIDESSKILHTARNILHCDQNPSQKICKMAVKFQYFVLREHSQDEVFAQALTGFMAANQSTEIVGVNIVQVEDSVIALQNYHQHMQVFEFLHQEYPSVHIALHAGEINPEAVRPKDLRFHIRDAIETGHAERIGHGVSIAYEDQMNDLLKKMSKTPIPVEINLTSNRVALNISGKNHPLRFYLANQVPLVLSTDDEGILRTDLTRQYVEAAFSHDLSYSTIKQMNRNTLTYSFLQGQSIWQDPNKEIIVNACLDLDSASCLQFIKNSPKAQLQWRLEKKLNKFEKNLFAH